MRSLLAALLAALLVVATAGPAAAADTVITSGPENGAVLLPGPVTYTFTANEGGASYECSVDNAPFGPCPAATSATYDLPPGQHVFRVRSVVMGMTDQTPAERTWRIRNVPCEQAGLAHLAAQASLQKHQVKRERVREKLRRAVDQDRQELVDRYRKKIKKLNKQIRADKAAVQAAAAQEQAAC